MIPGIDAYICNTTFWEPYAEELGATAADIKEALCQEDADVWYDTLMTKGLSNEDVRNLLKMVRAQSAPFVNPLNKISYFNLCCHWTDQ